MQSEDRDGIAAVVAGLLGVLIGLALRRMRRKGQDAPFTAIGPSTLIATPALAGLAADALDVDRADSRTHALLSLVIGAALAFFADELSRYLPSGAMSAAEQD